MTPLEKYQLDLQREDFIADEAQAEAVRYLNELYLCLLASSEDNVVDKDKRNIFNRCWGLFKTLFPYSITQTQPEIIKGLYFWGGVGRGKTYLVDMFYDCLPFKRKKRLHFHRFMRHIHHELTLLEGSENPLEIVAARFKKQADIICLDEFFVSDITDAMILATLLEAFFQQGLILVTTSNLAPKNLYRNGLQRARFLPAIELIEQYCQIVNIDAGVDYRQRTLTQAQIYYFPLGKRSSANLAHYFKKLTTEPRYLNKWIEINHRQLKAEYEAHGVVQFSFQQLCQTARSQNDYIEIAQIYHTVLVANVMAMEGDDDDTMRRFIAMVDEFYERNVTLIISAEVPLEHLYRNGRLQFEFQRCCSRLIEMQSQQYLTKPHLV